MPISVRHNIRDVRRSLSRVQRKQVPFAAAMALTNTAHTVRKHIVGTLWPNAFPRASNKRFPSVAFRVQRATKRRLQSAVYDRLGRHFIEHHITGEDKRPFTGSALAVPIEARRTASGRIRKADQPGGGGTFRANLGGAGEAIWRRGRQGLQLLYVLKGRTRVDRRFPFYRAGEARARTAFAREFDKSMRRALATARR